MILKPGIYPEIDIAEYHKDPAPEPSLSQSIAKILIDYSPLHAKAAHPRLTTPELADDEEKYVTAQAIGDAAHLLMIGRGKNLAIGSFDNWKTTESKKFKSKAIADGQTPILDKHFNQAHTLLRAATAQLEHHEESDCFKNGKGEVALIWNEGPIWFRCLVDWLHDDLVVADDFKTTQLSVAPHALGPLASNAGWEIQAAMIERGLNALDAGNPKRRKIRFVAMEQNVPYAINVMAMGEHWLTMGRKKLDYAIGVWSNCITRKKWPGYPPYAVAAEYPGWREQQWLTRELAEENKMLMNLSGG